MSTRTPMHQLTLRLPLRTCQQLRELAAQDQEGIAVVVRRVLRRGLELEARTPRGRRAVA